MDIVNVGHGDPTFFKKWWDHIDFNSIFNNIDFSNHNLYEYQSVNLNDTELDNSIHSFHQLFGSDSPSSKLIYGNGSTIIINSILLALTKKLERKIVVAYQPPVYMLMHEYILSTQSYEITYDINRTDIDVEIIIDPNNPTGKKSSSLSNAKYFIFDRAYNWPIYTSYITSTSTEKNHITVYTLSKLLGFGGLRVGWAFVNDISLFNNINRALLLMNICPNTLGFLLTKKILTYLTNDHQIILNYIQYCCSTIQQRRETLATIPFIEIINEEGPYAWIKHTNNLNISKFLFDTYNIKTISGLDFGSSDIFARFSLICSEQEFNTAVSRLQSSQ